MTKGTYYITTPIYYPSAQLHIGHAYTTVLCDAVARWRRFCGEDTTFLTGSDEHGLKILRSAQAAGQQPQEYVDEIVAGFKRLWDALNISHDVFLRTSEPRHHNTVQHIYETLYEKGDIYEGSYDGWYCTPCEAFWTENQLGDDQLCPDCGRSVEWVEEKSYFFRMSRYADALLEHIEKNPDFIQPETRRNEMVRFIESGLEDLSVTRTTFDWGIRVPFDEDHVAYVWIDALSNYLTGVGYLQDDEAFARWWPADVHVVGKDILRFHTVIWPAILLAAGLPLPKAVYGHGWFLVDSGRMAKSKGNVVDPHELIDAFGVDALRYFLLREMPYGQDANYTTRALIDRINFDLANDLGNALHRTVAMLGRFQEGVIASPADATDLDEALVALAEQTRTRVDKAVRQLRVNEALAELWRLVRGINKYIDDTQPWQLAKDENRERLHTVMAHIFGALRTVALLIAPFLPETGQKMWDQMGLAGDVLNNGFDASAWDFVPAGTTVHPTDPLFPRIDTEAFLAEVVASAEAEHSEGTDESGDGDAAEAEAETASANRRGDGNDGKGDPTLISFDEFTKVQMRVVKVLEADKVAGADRLLKLQVDLGDSTRQVVAGIAQHYDPEALVGKNVVIVANLEPVTLRGEKSEGMILAATDADGRLAVLTVDGDMAPGSTVS